MVLLQIIFCIFSQFYKNVIDIRILILYLATFFDTENIVCLFLFILNAFSRSFLEQVSWR